MGLMAAAVGGTLARFLLNVREWDKLANPEQYENVPSEIAAREGGTAGQAGQRKITQYTRYGTLVLATFQALGIAIALESQARLVIDPGLAFRFTTVVTLVTGTMFLMWLGEQITERGLGNGISIIIFAGIAAGLPNALGGLFELVRTGSMNALSAIFICLVVALVTYLVVFIERGQRKAGG